MINAKRVHLTLTVECTYFEPKTNNFIFKEKCKTTTIRIEKSSKSINGNTCETTY